MPRYYRIIFCIVLALIMLSTTIISAPSTSDAIQYETKTLIPSRVGGTVTGGGNVVSQGFTTQNIALQDCSAGTCDGTNSLNYGFDGTSSSKSIIRIVLTYDLSTIGINGSKIKDVTIRIGGCSHGGNGSLCDNNDNPEFDSAGGRLFLSIWDGSRWEAIGSATNLGGDASSSSDIYGTYQSIKSSGFADSYLDNGKLRIGVQTGGTTEGEYDVQQVIDFALLDVKYVPVRSDTRPNIVVIYTDDQRWDTVAYMPTVQSRIMGEGMNFSNSFVTDPLCCPSRASFLTGQYAHDHGVWTNHAPSGGATLFNDTSTLATWLQDGGYTTALVGKYLNDYKDMMPYVPPGWDEWHVHAPPTYYLYYMNDNGIISPRYGSTEADYSTDVLKDKAIEFISEADRPFFLWFNPDAPHVSPTGYAVPAKRHIGTCEDAQYRPPSFYEEDVSDKPQWIKSLPPANTNTTSNTDKISKGMACSLKAVDEAIDAIMDQLGPELDNTVIIFTSDNGYAWGEHRWNFKTCEYEECIRVPLGIRYPPLIAAGQESDAMVLNLDVTATIIDLAQVTPGLKQRGQSLTPLFGNPSANWRQDFLLEQAAFPDAGVTGFVPGFTGIRTTTDKYVELETGEFEYYDLINDPYELDNLIDDPAYADVIAQRQQRLLEIIDETYS